MAELTTSGSADTIKKEDTPRWQREILTDPPGATLSLDRPKLVEIGPGRGDFLWSLAASHPYHQLIAIETKRRRFMKLCAGAARRELHHIVFFCGDAKEVIPQFIRPESVEAIHIQFPDPWPKKRHAKHRLITPKSIDLLITILKPGGQLHFATDVDWYARDVAALFAAEPVLKSIFSPEPIVTTPIPQFKTYFADKWQKMGRTFYYQIWEKNAFTAA